jgi:hypothetical protein
MLLGKLCFELIERLSVKTMRYVSAVPRAKADGLVARIYDMIAEVFLSTARSPVTRKSRLCVRAYGPADGRASWSRIAWTGPRRKP